MAGIGQGAAFFIVVGWVGEKPIQRVGLMATSFGERASPDIANGRSWVREHARPAIYVLMCPLPVSARLRSLRPPSVLLCCAPSLPWVSPLLLGGARHNQHMRGSPIVRSGTPLQRGPVTGRSSGPLDRTQRPLDLFRGISYPSARKGGVMLKWIVPALVALVLVVIGLFALTTTRAHAPTVTSRIPPSTASSSAAPVALGVVLAVCRPPHIDASRGVCTASAARMSAAQASSAKLIIDATRLTRAATLHVAITRRQPDGAFAALSDWTESITAGTTSVQYPLADVLSTNANSTVPAGVYRFTLVITGTTTGPPALVTIEP